MDSPSNTLALGQTIFGHDNNFSFQNWVLKMMRRIFQGVLNTQFLKNQVKINFKEHATTKGIDLMQQLKYLETRTRKLKEAYDKRLEQKLDTFKDST